MTFLFTSWGWPYLVLIAGFSFSAASAAAEGCVTEDGEPEAIDVRVFFFLLTLALVAAVLVGLAALSYSFFAAASEVDW